MPDTENPNRSAPPSEKRYTPVEMSENEYHEIADEYMERLLAVCEEAQEQREELDIEYSVSFNSTHPNMSSLFANNRT
jgi:frataxin